MTLPTRNSPPPRNDTSFLPSRFHEVPCIQKPVPVRLLLDAVRGVPMVWPIRLPLQLRQSE